jgi:hypothetical protein
MIILVAFLAGISFVIAVSACVSAQGERQRAIEAEAKLDRLLTDQMIILTDLAKNDVELDRMIRAVAVASMPPTFPVDQSKVYISVPGPRTRQ